MNTGYQTITIKTIDIKATAVIINTDEYSFVIGKNYIKTFFQKVKDEFFAKDSDGHPFQMTLKEICTALEHTTSRWYVSAYSKGTDTYFNLSVKAPSTHQEYIDFIDEEWTGISKEFNYKQHKDNIQRQKQYELLLKTAQARKERIKNS